MATFQWRSGFSPGVDAQAAGQEIERVREENGGAVKPEQLVEAARDEANPLHPCFEWDDSVAGERWRQSEARKLLSGIRVIRAVDGRPRQVIAFVSVNDPERGRGYQPTQTVMATDVLRDRAMMEAMQQLEAWERRFRHLAGLEPLFRAIQDMKQAV